MILLMPLQNVSHFQAKFKCRARLHTDGLIVVYRSDTQHSHDPVPITKNKYMDDDDYAE